MQINNERTDFMHNSCGDNPRFPIGGNPVGRFGTSSSPEFNTPPQDSFDTEEMKGSMQRILADNIGEYVVVEFLIGTDRITRKQGLLYFVGTSFVTLYDDTNNNFIVCDIFSIKFVYFYLPGQRPPRNFNVLPNSSSAL